MLTKNTLRAHYDERSVSRDAPSFWCPKHAQKRLNRFAENPALKPGSLGDKILGVAGYSHGANNPLKFSKKGPFSRAFPNPRCE